MISINLVNFVYARNKNRVINQYDISIWQHKLNRLNKLIELEKKKLTMTMTLTLALTKSATIQGHVTQHTM